MDDAVALFQGYTQDPEVTRYVGWLPHRSLADTRAYLRSCIDGWREETRFPWAITVAAVNNDTPIGIIELRLTGHMADVGYVLARSEWGNGYMTEALTAVVAAALALDACYRVWAVCDVENGASARVMEKAGMTREGVLRRFLYHPGVHHEPRDAYCYSRTR
jgi:RimJ/RimL family protein N-acetyltransferase